MKECDLNEHVEYTFEWIEAGSLEPGKCHVKSIKVLCQKPFVLPIPQIYKLSFKLIQPSFHTMAL